jgi:hypothetical protein
MTFPRRGTGGGWDVPTPSSPESRDSGGQSINPSVQPCLGTATRFASPAWKRSVLVAQGRGSRPGTPPEGLHHGTRPNDLLRKTPRCPSENRRSPGPAGTQDTRHRAGQLLRAQPERPSRARRAWSHGCAGGGSFLKARMLARANTGRHGVQPASGQDPLAVVSAEYLPIWAGPGPGSAAHGSRSATAANGSYEPEAPASESSAEPSRAGDWLTSSPASTESGISTPWKPLARAGGAGALPPRGGLGCTRHREARRKRRSRLSRPANISSRARRRERG